jgi:hypothetical protein
MKRGVLIVLVLAAVSAIVLPWRFGIVWLVAPALVVGLLGLSGLMGAYDEDADESDTDPALAEHGVKLLIVSALLCMVGIIGGIRSCEAASQVAPAPAESAEPSFDPIRQRGRQPAPAPSDFPLGARPEGPQLQ